MEKIEPTFGWVGGAVCLDFVNTVGSHRARIPSEKLRRFEDLVSWCHKAGILDEAESGEMLRRAKAVPSQGDRLLHLAIDFREALYRTFADISHREQPAKADLAIINGLLGRTPITLQVDAKGNDFVCSRTGCALDEAQLLGPVAWSAADLLGSKESLAKICQCAAEDCGWLFLDLTKNHSRRWCAMDDCGSRAKAKRYYRRKTGKE